MPVAHVRVGTVCFLEASCWRRPRLQTTCIGQCRAVLLPNPFVRCSTPLRVKWALVSCAVPFVPYHSARLLVVRLPRCTRRVELLHGLAVLSQFFYRLVELTVNASFPSATVRGHADCIVPSPHECATARRRKFQNHRTFRNPFCVPPHFSFVKRANTTKRVFSGARTAVGDER